MKRSRVHLLFGLAAAGFALLAAHDGLQLRRAEQINAAIASASAGGLGGDVPEAILARALSLARAGDYEAALKTYKAVIQSPRADLRQIARYDLGNLYLHQALKDGAATALEWLPLIELAKQSYRDLLRDGANDWDARYNLERTLWLAPEVAEEGNEENRPTQWQKRTIRGLPDFRMELP